MSRPTSPAWLRARHYAAVIALLAAPLAGVAWSFLVPLFTGSMDAEVANIAATPGRFVAGTYLGVVMSFLMVPAVLAIGRLLRPSAPVGSDIAMVLTALGACFHGAVLVFQLAETAIIAATPDRVAATTLVNKLFEHQVFGMVLAPFFAFYLGLLTLAVIMLVRRAVPIWIPIVILVAIPIEMAGPMLWKARLFFVLLTIAFAGLAMVVRRIGADEWARRWYAPPAA